MRLCLAAFATVLFLMLIGCSGGGKVVVSNPTTRDFLGEFQQALTDAVGTLTSVQSAAANPRPRSADAEDMGEEEKPDDLIRGAVRSVASAADQLAQSAAGHAIESDAKAIATEAQDLLKKTQSRPNAAEALQAVKQLATKAESLKSRL